MRLILQRVTQAQVRVDQAIVGKIDLGLMILIGVGGEDKEEHLAFMAEKIVNLRIFEDAQGKMNLSLKDVGGSILAISQFTLYASLKKGRRPDFFQAANPQKGNDFYQKMIAALEAHNIKVETGIFGAHMDVDFINSGPVTIILDTDDFFPASES